MTHLTTPKTAGRPWFALCLIFAAIIGIVPAQAQSTPAQSTPLPAVKAARLFDATKGSTIPNAIVIIEGTTIKAVGSGTGVAIPPGATVVDLGDVTLLPGFIDAHTHLSMESSENWFADTVGDLRRS